MKLISDILFGGVFIASSIAYLPTASAELLKVEQKIYGMDCAPCAYGVEKGLKKLEGVKKAQVSLNKGTAVVELKPGNNVTVDQIKDIVKRNGFTPKETRILEGSKDSKLPAQ